MKLSNKTYDTIKFIALLIAPIATFVAALVDIWDTLWFSDSCHNLCSRCIRWCISSYSQNNL